MPLDKRQKAHTIDIIRNNKFHTNDYSIFNEIWLDSDHEKIMAIV